MATFLTTTGISHELEKLITGARDRLWIVSPYLRVNQRVRELLEEKDRERVDVRIVYGKTELSPQETNWLKGLDQIKTSFYENLHAKCFLSEHGVILSSMNLYEFSQVNNVEMGIIASVKTDERLYKEAYQECRRLLQNSQAVKLSAEDIAYPAVPDADESVAKLEKLSSSKIARQHKLKTAELLERLVTKGFLVLEGGEHRLTDAGAQAGGELKNSPRFGEYFIWPVDIDL